MAKNVPGREISVLGPVAVRADGAPVPIGGPKQRAVLALLVARLGKVVTTDELIDGIWGDEPPAAVHSSLHTYVSNLRTGVGYPIDRQGSGYLLAAERGKVDAYRFEGRVDECRRSLLADPQAASDGLRQALGLWRGRAYADVYTYPGLYGEANRLEELRLSAVEARIEADLALGRHAVLVGELEALAAEYPLRESLRAKHMLALYRDGRQADALRAFSRTQQYLREEMGVDPSPDLQELEERILNHDYGLLHARDAVTNEVALLFTDIASAARLWAERRAGMRTALPDHDEILRSAIEGAGGSLIKSLGGGWLAAFGEPSQAVRAAVTAQRAIQAREWPVDLRVRMALDYGEVEHRGGDLFGPPVNRGARMLAVSHGGQILLSPEVHRKLGREAGIQVKNLGEHRFSGLPGPLEAFQLVAEDLASTFPPLAPDAGARAGADRIFGDLVGGYELREKLGESDASETYRAYQASMGREVAVKIFRPEVAAHPAFVRSFETECRFVASLEHPHIVSLYDYWRDSAGAYLAMPYLEGGSLADRTGPRPMAEVAELVATVGAALSHAHRHGVLHLDIRPTNVLIDGDGHAYLADFGSSIRAVEAATGVARPAGYRPPEDEPGVPGEERADLYGLAAVVAWLLTGQEPPHFDLSGVGTDPRRALERALAPEPDRRTEGVDEFVDSFLSGAGTVAWQPSASFRNPYKGLAAFREADWVDFCGRDREIRQAVAMVNQHRLSAVVGPSGSGKSSLVLAGLVPALRNIASSGKGWVTVRMVPGRDPFEELAGTLAAVSTFSAAELARRLTEDERGLLRISEATGRELDAELLLVVDQFEELFTLVAETEMKDRFVAALVAATSSDSSRIRVILTLRADFFHEMLGHPDLGRVITSRHLALAPLDRDSILAAITGPAAEAGLHFEPGLAERIVSDVVDQPGSLPLLEFTLDRLAAASTDGRIAHGDYDVLGGVRGAIAERAEAAYLSLTGVQRQLSRHIFTRLLIVSDEAGDLRRRVRISEFRSLGLPEADVEEVLATFGRERLLTFDVDPLTRGATVEVAHEALLREWPTLLEWVEVRRESLMLQRRFQTAHAEWEESGRSDSDLLAGGRLSQFQDWAGGEDVMLTASERQFLDAAVTRRHVEQASRRRRRRQVLGSFGAVALVAVLLAVVAVGQRAEAERSALLADARSLVLEAEGTVEIDPELSIMLSLEAVQSFRDAGREPPVSAVATLRQGVNASFVDQRLPGGRFVAVSDDGTHLATKGEGEQVAVRELATGELMAELPEQGGVPFAANFLPDDRLIVVYGGLEDGLRLWNWQTGEVTRFGGTPLEPFFTLLAHSDQGLLAIPRGDADSVEVWSVIDQELKYVVDDALAPSFSEDGKLHLLHWAGEPATWQGGIRVVDAETGTELDPLPIDGLDFDPVFLDVTADGLRAALSGVDRTSVAAVDLAGGGRTLWTTTLTRAFQPRWVLDGERILVGGETSPHLLDGRSGEVIRQLHGAVRGGISDSAPVPGTTQWAAVGWSAEEIAVLALGTARSDYPTIPSSFAYGPNAHLVTVGEGSHLAVSDEVSHGLIDADTGELVSRRPGEPFEQGRWNYPIFSNGGLFAAGPTDDGRSVLWSNVDLREVYVAPEGWDIRGMSDDGSQVVIVDLSVAFRPGIELPVRLVRTGDGSTVAELTVGGSQMPEAAFSPDGTVVLTNNNEAEAVYRLWDTSTGALIREIEPSVANLKGWNQRFTPDGSRLVVAGHNGTIWVLDVESLLAGRPTGESVLHQIDAHNTFITHIWFSRDGSMFLSDAHNGPIKVWSLETGEKLGEFGTGDRMVGDFHPTEPLLYVPLPGDQIGVYALGLDDLVKVARSRLTREMTEHECREYLGGSCGTGG